jgi:hypothetical protein
MSPVATAAYSWSLGPLPPPEMGVLPVVLAGGGGRAAAQPRHIGGSAFEPTHIVVSSLALRHGPPISLTEFSVPVSKPVVSLQPASPLSPLFSPLRQHSACL